MSSSAPRLVVRCFAKEDEGLVDEWPVVLSPDAVQSLVPASAAPGALGEIHLVERATAEQLVGRALPEATEPVEYFLEPATIAPSPE